MHQNARQVELKARLKDMLIQALIYIKTEICKGNTKPYDKEFDLEYFLAEYRVKYGVGYYASKRYFKDFETVGYFNVEGDIFHIVYEEIQYNPYRIQFSKPKQEIKLKQQ